MHTLHIIYSLMPPEAWTTLVCGPLSSLILSKLKRWLALQSEKVIVFLLLTITTLGGLGTYALTSIDMSLLWIAPYMGMITTISLAFYHLLYKPAINLINDAKAQREAGLDGTPIVPGPVEQDLVAEASHAEFSA